MKKIIILLLLLTLTGCNRQIIDLEYKYDYAIVNGEKIQIKSWKDYEQSDMLQVTSVDGKVYLTHSSNIVLIKG